VDLTLADALAEAAAAMRVPLLAGEPVVAVGSGTHAGVGNAVAATARPIEIRRGIVRYEPADMTVRVWAGTTVAELGAVLAERGQEVPLDPRDDHATVGGVLASGLSGHRRLRLGPLRDTLLQVDAVDGCGTLFKGGGPTVKNVTGYDVPRLMVGSLGTLAILLQVTLRCRPRPPARAWHRIAGADPDAVRAALFRPSAMLWDGQTLSVLLEGDAGDLAAEAARGDLGSPVPDSPAAPDGPHRGRISIAPGAVRGLVARLDAVDGVRWLAEVGVGTVHVATDSADLLAAARRAAHEHGGWLLREAGGDADGFGIALPNLDVLRRLKESFDPHGLLAPGRLPL
jgi:glycolate oxidase FAD binding subunit